MRTCPLYYCTIKDYCTQHSILPLVTVDHNLVYQKDNKYYLCRYTKVNGVYKFDKVEEQSQNFILTFLNSQLKRTAVCEN